MSDELKGITFWRSYYDSADKLRGNPELLSSFLMSILDYAFEDLQPGSDDPIISALFQSVKPAIDMSKQKARNGKQGGSKPKQTASKQKANGSKAEAISKKKEEKEIKKYSPSESSKKVRFGDTVTMSNAEYEALLSTHGESDTKRMIEILDNYKASSGKTYKSDYRAILSWVVDRLAEDKKRQKPVDTKKKSIAETSADEMKRSIQDWKRRLESEEA